MFLKKKITTLEIYRRCSLHTHFSSHRFLYFIEELKSFVNTANTDVENIIVEYFEISPELQPKHIDGETSKLRI